jgi:Flp pilus assembly protein TadD
LSQCAHCRWPSSVSSSVRLSYLGSPAQRFNADRPESRSALGSFFAKTGRPVEAEAEYKAALRLSQQYAPAATNLADLYRGLGREADGEGVLRAALVASPQDAGLHYALGLTLVRQKRADGALAGTSPSMPTKR